MFPNTQNQKNATNGSNHSARGNQNAGEDRPVFQSSQKKFAMEKITVSLRACFWLSTLSGAFCLGAGSYTAAQGYISPIFFDPNYFLLYYGYIAITLLFAVKVCHLVDFYFLIPYTHIIVSDSVAYISGRFTFTKLKLFELAIYSGVAIAANLISFTISWKGSELVAIFSKTKTGATELEAIKNLQQVKESPQITELKTELDRLIAVQEKELKSAGGADLRKMSADGNGWAMAEVKKAEDRVRSSYNKRISEATARLATARDKGQKIADEANALTIAQVKSSVKDENQKSGAVQIILLLFGVAPLVVGVALISISAIGEVQEKIEDLAEEKSKGKGYNAGKS